MKYFLSCTMALCMAMLVQVMAQTPQGPVYKKLNLDPAYRVGALSPNGKFMIGAATYKEYPFRYNLETDEVVYLDEEGQSGISAKSVTDDGLVIGSYGSNISTQQPALWKDGAWELLPVPEKPKASYGAANSITEDNKIIVGYYDNLPCYWVLTGGKYEFNELPSGKDWNGQDPQWVTAYGVSSDGSVISGAIRDRRGFVPLPTTWIRNSEGVYGEMKTLCKDLCLNAEFLPGPSVVPQYDDYVTAPQGTPEYDEQRAKWDEVWNKYEEEYGKCTKDFKVNPQSGTLSPDGKYLTTTASVPFQDPHNPEVTRLNAPLRVNVATDQAETYQSTTDQDGFTVQILGNLTNKDGVLFATVQDGFFISTTFVYPTSDSEPIELYKWLKEQYNLDISEDLTYYMDYMDKDSVLTGSVAMSASGNILVGSSGNPNGGAFTTYSIKFPETSGINESTVTPTVTLFAKDGTIYLNGKAEEIAVSDMSGKMVFRSRVNGNEVNVGQLQKGIYIVELNTVSGKQFHKIILN